MCVTCGCGHPKKDHGDDRNLTRKDFQEAALAANIDMHHLVANINDAYTHGELSGGKSKPDEKKLAPAAVVHAPVKTDKEIPFKLIAKTSARRFTLGVAYRPNVPDVSVAMDGHRDIISEAELEEGAWKFLTNNPKVGINHVGEKNAGTVVESYIYRGPDWIVSQSLTITAGSWLVGVIWEPWAWEHVVNGRLKGISPEGNAARRSHG
jgi:hypothetical protein